MSREQQHFAVGVEDGLRDSQGTFSAFSWQQDTFFAGTVTCRILGFDAAQS